MALNIVLVEPEIPQNTGNIARTCACTGAALHLVGPLGFKIDDRQLKRAGLDYWHSLEIYYYEDLNSFMTQHRDAQMYFCSTKAHACYSAVSYPPDCFLVFGKETAGLPEALLRANSDSSVRIPMANAQRSLNLSNSVAIVVYEALRQQGFLNLELEGSL